MIDTMTMWKWALLVVLFLVWHWYSDFRMQTEYMALNKAKSNRALLSHVAVQTLWVMPAYLYLYLVLSDLPYSFIVIFAASNLVIHFGIDWVTSRVVSHLHQIGNRSGMFQVIGVDQMLHYLTYLGLTLWAIKASSIG